MKNQPESGGDSDSRAILPAVADDTSLAIIVDGGEALPSLDAHGFDPADFKWVPVRRQRRPDGWSHTRQRTFIEALADTGSVTGAAREVGMSITSCYRLRRAPGAENFAAAWDAAIEQASKRLVEVAFDRALNGVEDPVFDKHGLRIACRQRYNDRLLMFLLRAHQPERYRHAHASIRRADEPPPPVAAPLEAALVALAPVTPPAPHLLMPPGELEVELYVADILGGKLPHYYRDPGPDPDPALAAAPLGVEFERALEWAKNGVHPPPGDEDEAEDVDEDDVDEYDELDEFDDDSDVDGLDDAGEDASGEAETGPSLA